MAGNRKARSNDDLVVAGAGADGHGVMCGFGGDGPLTRDTVIDLARRSTIDESWFPPAKDAKVQLTRAMRTVAGRHGMNAEAFKKKNRQTVEARDWSSCWCMIAANAEQTVRAGEAFGHIVFVATLFDDDAGQELQFDLPEHALAIEVRAEYERLTGAELYQAADITGWLAHIHRDMLGGVRLGFGWYVPREHRAIAEQIADTFWNEARYGERWICPPLPVATSAQLQRGIADGLCAEVDEQLALLDGQRRKLRAARGGFDANGVAFDGGWYDETGKLVDIGSRAAESFAVRFARVGHRIGYYATQLGDALVSDCNMRIHDAMIEIDLVLEGGATDSAGKFRDVIAENEAREAQAVVEVATPIALSEATDRERTALTTWWTFERSKGNDVGKLGTALAVAKFDRVNDRIMWRESSRSVHEIIMLVD